jgi:hypothetical protein
MRAETKQKLESEKTRGYAKKLRVKMPCRDFILGIRLLAIPVRVEDKLVGREKD